MVSFGPPLAEERVPEEIEGIAAAWHGLVDAADAGDLQAAIFLQKFGPWAREQLARWERA